LASLPSSPPLESESPPADFGRWVFWCRRMLLITENCLPQPGSGHTKAKDMVRICVNEGHKANVLLLCGSSRVSGKMGVMLRTRRKVSTTHTKTAGPAETLGTVTALVPRWRNATGDVWGCFTGIAVRSTYNGEQK
jgi:hypothetical protein